MKKVVVKTTFEKEWQEKELAWLKLSPIERMDRARNIRERMKKPDLNYSLEGLKVSVKRFS